MESNQPLNDAASALVLAVMASASTDDIRPTDWWVRARSALYSAAAMADSFSDMVSVMGRKLSIDGYKLKSSQTISKIAAEITDWEGFRRHCERDALYIVAEAQVLRQLQREREEAEKKAKKARKPVFSRRKEK
ncbi:MAG: hypothetical protein ACWGQW_18615 [bacterium]